MPIVMRSCTSALTHSLFLSPHYANLIRLCCRIYTDCDQRYVPQRNRKTPGKWVKELVWTSPELYKWEHHEKTRFGVIHFTFLCFSFLICKTEGTDTYLCIATLWLLDKNFLENGQISKQEQQMWSCVHLLDLQG